MSDTKHVEPKQPLLPRQAAPSLKTDSLQSKASIHAKIDEQTEVLI